MLTINDKISIRISEFRFSYTRSPGPGGQHVNKVNSKAIMKWSVDKSNALPDAMKQRFMKKFARRITKDGELVIQSHRYREQGRNVADCLHKLREMILEVAVEPKKRKPAKVSKSAKRRRVEAKRRKSEKKQSRRGPKMDD
jgi:ribosome-associated protein